VLDDGAGVGGDGEQVKNSEPLTFACEREGQGWESPEQ
jgi:hypothetical protein